jgi:hypothetical protein
VDFRKLSDESNRQNTDPFLYFFPVIMRIFFNGTVALKSFVLIFATLVCVLALGGHFSREYEASAASSGPSASHTNAPGEDNCTSCHTSFPVNSGAGSVTVTGIPANYLPNQQIQVTVITADSGPSASIFGFQLTAVDSLGRRAGTFTLPTQNPAKTQLIGGIVAGNDRQYVEHTIDGLFTTGVFGSNTWTFTWTAPSQRIGKIDFYASGNAANSDGTNSGDYIYTVSRSSLTGTAIANFDGDTKSEFAVFRPSNGMWYSLNSSDGAFVATQFGQNGDKIVPGDYDGDGKTDNAVYRPSNGAWYMLRSTAGFTAVGFGSPGDIPAQADFDGDLKTDVAVYRPSNGTWYLYQTTAGFSVVPFGTNEDIPVPGDYDGDGISDIAVFRPSTGVWYMFRSTAGFGAIQFGSSGDKPVQGDYDGDGKTDFAVFRPSNGAWYQMNSTSGFWAGQFGRSSDIPSPGDFDGDGKTDIAVFRPSEGYWYGLKSSDLTLFFGGFGLNGDIPVPSGYVAQ